MIPEITPYILAAVTVFVVVVVLVASLLLRPVHRYGYKHLFEALRETTFDSVFLLDGDGRIKAANEVAVGAFGQTMKAMLDQPLSSLFIREDEGQYAGVVEADAILERDFYRNSRTIHAMAVGPGQQEFRAEVRVRPVFGSLQPRFVVVIREVMPKISRRRNTGATHQKYRRMFNEERPPEGDPVEVQQQALQQ
ncbi:MAG TPA: PAS domain-containing protein [Woeseiaceae bacterium]|nr:PAS domain-containing protein [Woeseiaceae bacterium]